MDNDQFSKFPMSQSKRLCARAGVYTHTRLQYCYSKYTAFCILDGNAGCRGSQGRFHIQENNPGEGGSMLQKNPKQTKERIRSVMGKEDYLRFICNRHVRSNLRWVPPVPPGS